MEQQPNPTPEPPEGEPRDEPAGCGTVILKLIAGAAVLFVVVVALVFGVCFLG